MGISGKIDQITSSHGRAFANLEYDYGEVEIESYSYECPTYLWISGCSWGIKIFDSIEYFEEWTKSDEFTNTKIKKLFRFAENRLDEILEI
jgi:hypothetical protein